MGAITVKGQVTIPKRVRDALGVKPGDQVRFDILEDGGARITPVQPPREATFLERMKPFVGAVDLGMTTDAFMLMMRGDPAEDPQVTLSDDTLRLLNDYADKAAQDEARRGDPD